MEFLGTGLALALIPFVEKWAERRLIRVRKRVEKWPDSWFKRLLLTEVRASTESEKAVYRSE